MDLLAFGFFSKEDCPEGVLGRGRSRRKEVAERRKGLASSMRH